jgi:bacterioferritin
MDGFVAHLPRVIDVLNEALTAELVCVLRYKQHHVTADRIAAKELAREFLEHAGDCDELLRVRRAGVAPRHDP